MRTTQTIRAEEKVERCRKRECQCNGEGVHLRFRAAGATLFEASMTRKDAAALGDKLKQAAESER